jgi:predicted CXXCH cytochrome family protein
MLNGKEDTICFQCHAALQKGLGAGKAKHAPVMAGECTKCHSPHKSKLAKLLLVESPDLCLTCHTVIKARMAAGMAHPPAQRDCLRCHQPHVSQETTLLSQSIPALCSDCHDLKGKEFAKDHMNINAAAMNCRTCHDPHGSKDPKLFKDVEHPPFAARSCDDCHIGEK